MNRIPERIRMYVCPECGWKSILGEELHYTPRSAEEMGAACGGTMVEAVYQLVLVGAGPVGSTRNEGGRDDGAG